MVGGAVVDGGCVRVGVDVVVGVADAVGVGVGTSSQFGGHFGGLIGFEHVHFATMRSCCGSNQTGVPFPSTDWTSNGQGPSPSGKHPWLVTGVGSVRIRVSKRSMKESNSLSVMPCKLEPCIEPVPVGAQTLLQQIAIAPLRLQVESRLRELGPLDREGHRRVLVQDEILVRDLVVVVAEELG